MIRALPRLLAFGAVVAGIACVEIATGPSGVVSIGQTPRPAKAVSLGDSLRDSTGAVMRLRPVGYGTSGDSVAKLAFQFLSLPIGGDTTQSKLAALIVDPTSGLVRAPTTWIDDSGRVAITLGSRLQIVDTFVIVPRPRSLTRTIATGDTVLKADSTEFYFDCRTQGDALDNGTVPDTNAFLVYRKLPFGTVTTIGTRILSGDSVTGTSIPVRRYLVRYVIESVTGLPSRAALKIPTATLTNGSTRPALGLITRSGGVAAAPDTRIGFDTTDATGATTVRLRFFPTALAAAAGTDSLIRVVIRASAPLTSTTAVTDTFPAIVLLHRFVSNPRDGTPLSCPAP